MAIKRTINNYDGVDTTQKFTVINKFLGYRSREDKTILPAGYMIPGSQNVLIDISGRLKSRKGFTLDGQADASLTGIYACYDWEEHRNTIHNLRATTGILQFRYAPNSVYWVTIKTGLGTDHIRFTNFWNDTEKINVLLFVDGSNAVYEWSGATTTFASATTNTITKQGTETWAEAGFYVSTSPRKIMLDGVEYTYTGGETTTTLTGVTPDPTSGTPTAGDLIYQSVKATTTITGNGGDPFFNQIDGISNVQNQIYYGSQGSNNIYVSKINDYTNVSYTSPVRVVGEGAKITLRSPWVGFAPQEDQMYITAGKSQWYQTKKQLSSDNADEEFTVVPLKTSAKQSAISQEAITHDRNDVVFISNENRLVTLGRTVNIFGTPMMTDYSPPIANDFDNFDFTGAWAKYWKTYIYLGLPAEGKLYILNQTDPNNVFWEAPQTGSFGGASIIDGELYLHGDRVPETYKWLDGYNDNGHPIFSRAMFAYVDYGTKNSKYFNEYWIDGYISANTELEIIYNLDLDGCATSVVKKFLGTSKNVCSLSADASLGKSSLGKHGLGTNSLSTTADPLPPYFQVIKQGVRKDFYKFSPTFQSYGKDYHWELLSFGPLVTQSMYGNGSIKEN